ncbi:helix-turn-helix transcriptional regulator [Xanthomonas oryzae]|uniref:helix-turn-helix transcriptional regulator n=2 Tax=Xanthomonas oryzae TaxID=347 RepID=UPI0009B576F0|nr:XRE family transcriptional regulator [Xanthomonas oryzae pv. oryzae]RBF79973.1 XRE family transcriptional regulator [Xanthomonas oryzae pv. oryzae]RBJ43803.1 XRE family transcriptional regulator [Xanthomonas oryzae pv. oryzae]RBK65378.1 XRE family transcriptional regulator [Xanthomonas oryzae pv. oryzae]RBL06939.1 XRE family transcriptional regulator [Xanthomonas oryzae pv. oryzae]
MEGNNAMSSRIKIARNRCGMSQRELALVLGISRATVAHWERPGSFLPSTRRLAQLGQALGVSVEWLACGQNPDQQRRATAITQFSRKHLETRMIEMSRNIPTSMLAVVVAFIENFSEYLV